MSTLPRRGWRLSTSQADSRHLSVWVTVSFGLGFGSVGIARDVRVTAESADLRSCLRKAILVLFGGVDRCFSALSPKLLGISHAEKPPKHKVGFAFLEGVS